MAGIYVHIPFCRSKCAYCDFFSIGMPGGEMAAQYAAAIPAELDLRAAELADQPINTIYIGGGTPSMLPMPVLARLIESIAARVDMGAVAEFTIEANPEDVTPRWLDAVRALGVNRISIGVQSFDDSELGGVERRHDARSSLAALGALRGSGINYSADLIYGLPGQTIDAWERNLDTLLGFAPPHFSAYLLSYEPGTRLYASLRAGRVAEASDSLAADMYHALCAASAAASYTHYEISAFARPGMEARHNSAYWNLTPYLGLGCAAHSLSADGIRRYNPDNIPSYIRSVTRGVPVAAVDPEDETDRLNDYIITSLRTDAGLDTRFLGRRWGAASAGRFMDVAGPLVSNGSLVPVAGDKTRLRIPERSWLTADAVLRELIFDHQSPRRP